MDLKEFGKKVEADPALRLESVEVEKRFVVVLAMPSADVDGAFYSVGVDAILAYTEKELFDCLHGKTDPRPLHHMARIVGYYSALRNWNKSKLAELADRHRGDYGIDESKDRWKERRHLLGSDNEG